MYLKYQSKRTEFHVIEKMIIYIYNELTKKTVMMGYHACTVDIWACQ